MSKRNKSQEKCLPYEIMKRVLSDDKIANVIYSMTEEDDPLIWCDLTKMGKTYPTPPRMDKKMIMDWTLDVSISAAICGWRHSKQVYRFDPDFIDLLTEKTGDSPVPVEVLMKMPYKVVFLEPMNCFVYFDRSYTAGMYEMKILQFADESHVLDYLCIKLIPGKSVQECLHETNAEMLTADMQSRVEPYGFDGEDLSANQMSNVDLAKQVINALLYICSQNADIQENPKSKQTYRKTKTVKDQFKEVRTWDVGTVVIKAFKQSSRGTGSHREHSSSGWTQRPHMRRAHFHHFWKGPKENRELILKWLPPTYVNADLGESHVTVNKVGS